MQYAFEKRITTHGGELQRGKRKTRRPIAEKRPMHLVLKSEKAKGKLSLLHPQNARFIREFLPKLAKKHAVRVYEWKNVGNHLHMAILAKHRRLFQRFLRILGAQIAVHVTGARKGRPTGKFWTLPPFTRIVQWGRDFEGLKRYVRANGTDHLAPVEYTKAWQSPSPPRRQSGPSGCS
jgi:hypothetical protein